MNEQHRRAALPSSLTAATFYNLLSFLLLPVTVLGYVVWAGGALLAGRGSGVSGTAQGPLSARFFAHRLGTRQDQPADRLMMALPNVPPLGLRLFVWPMLLAHRLTGYVPKAFRYPFEGDVPPQYQASARMTFFDEVVARYLPGLSQFVILGAGFDTRAFRLPADMRVRTFEVDAPKTQAVKREALERADIHSAGVTFVAADFEHEDWLNRLVGAGFDPRKPTLYLWEGMMPYLEKLTVETALRKVASTAKDSVIAFDYMTTEPLKSRGLYWSYARVGTKAAGEPLKFGIDSTPPSAERLAEFLKSCGLSPGEQRTLGEETEGKRAWGGFATAVVK